MLKYLVLWFTILLMFVLTLSITLTPIESVISVVHIVTEDSMKPTFNKGDVVILTRNYESINIGDIIGYINKGNLVIRRVIRIIKNDNKTIFITKGDASKEPDPQPIYSDQIVGKYLLHIPRIGLPIIMLRNFLRIIHVID